MQPKSLTFFNNIILEIKYLQKPSFLLKNFLNHTADDKVPLNQLVKNVKIFPFLLVKSVFWRHNLIMERKLMLELRSWQQDPRRKPLILMGVRQTGKTFLLEQFGNANFKHYHLINFEEQVLARNLFEEDLDPQKIINKLRLFLNKDIDIEKDLVIFDEIQACPKALTSLKYFYEKMPQLALCSAGSLLGLHLSEGSYPVGKVDIKKLYPLSFDEFLLGIGETKLYHYLETLKLEDSISLALHAKLWEQLKYYFICGGLPEVITQFALEKENLFKAFATVRIKQEELIKGYYADIAKHAGKINSMHISRTWLSVPKQLAENIETDSPRFKFKGIVPNLNRYSQLVNVIDWLQAAELIIKIPIVHNAEQPLHAFTQDNMFKLLVFDVGILGALSGLSPQTILSYDYGTYKGYFAENYLAQQLLSMGHHKIYCWQFERSEIEFLIELNGHILPLEVKSGYVTKAKSLDKFIKKYHSQHNIIFSANPLFLDEKKKVAHVPLYLANQFKILI